MSIRKDAGGPQQDAAYGCAPVVRSPLWALTDGSHVRGNVVGGLGQGSNPLDMLTFTDPFDRTEYLVVTINARPASPTRP